MTSTSYQFEELTDAEVPTRRTNPFDAKVWETWEEKFKAEGRWAAITVDEDDVNRIKTQIRSAAEFYDIGMEFAKEQDTDSGVRIAFRAKEKKVSKATK
jgi:hypothetical protein